MTVWQQLLVWICQRYFMDYSWEGIVCPDTVGLLLSPVITPIRWWPELLGKKHHERIIYNILQTTPVVLIFLLIRFSVWPQEISPKRKGEPQLASQSASLSAVVYAVCANNFSIYLQKNLLVLSIPIQNLTLPSFYFDWRSKHDSFVDREVRPSCKYRLQVWI